MKAPQANKLSDSYRRGWQQVGERYGLKDRPIELEKKKEPDSLDISETAWLD